MERSLLIDGIGGERLLVVVFVVVVVVAVDVTSTGFLERFLPLCMCLSQYLESGYASFEHLHFFPSVLLHLPGSGSTFLPNPISKHPQPTAATDPNKNCSFSLAPKKNKRNSFYKSKHLKIIIIFKSKAAKSVYDYEKLRICFACLLGWLGKSLEEIEESKLLFTL